MTEKVFLSYAYQDRAFVEFLKPRLGELLRTHAREINILDMQPSDIGAGNDFRRAIKGSMDAADTVVIVSSPNGDQSDWVNYEAGLADALGKKLVFVGRKGTGKSALMHRFLDSASFVEVEDRG